MSVYPQWNLKETVSATGAVIAAATNDNVQVLTILVCGQFGNTLPICDETLRNVETEALSSPPPVVIQILRAAMGYSTSDCATQLGKSVAGIRFLGLAAALINSTDVFLSAKAISIMLRNTASGPMLLPTLQQLRDLLASLEPRLQRCGFAKCVTGWHIFLLKTVVPYIHKEYNQGLHDGVLKGWQDSLLTATPSSEMVAKLVDTFRQLARNGESTTVRATVKVTTAAPWIIAFIKWFLGRPPSVHTEDERQFYGESISSITVVIRMPTASMENGLEISTHEAAGQATEKHASDGVSDIDTDIDTDIESVFSGGISLAETTSSTGAPSIQYSGISEITSALLSHPEFKSLCATGIYRVDKIKCRAHFKGFLKAYAKNLKEEAKDHLEIEVAAFMESMAGRISDEFRRAIVSSTEEVQLEESVSRKTLENQLATIKAQGEARRGEGLGPNKEQPQAGDPDDISESENRPFELTTGLKEFILSAKSFESLIADLKSWLKVDGKRFDHAAIASHEDLQNSMELAGNQDNSGEFLRDLWLQINSSLMKSLGGAMKSLLNSQSTCAIFYSMIDAFIPSVKEGYRRLKWRCSCGTLLYGDFDNSDPEALQELFEELHHVPQVIEVAHQNRKAYKTVYVNHAKITGRRLVEIKERIRTRSGIGNQDPIPRTSQSLSANIGTASLQQNNSTRDTMVYDGERHAPGIHISALTPIVYPPPRVLPQKRQYFEVCINVGNYAVALNEINLDCVTSDADLFHQILDRYRRIRGYGIRKVFLKPRDVHFVRFSVSQAYNDMAGIHGKPSEYPPQEEIDKQRYHYQCPKIIMPAHVFLHFLSRPRGDRWNSHLHNTWLQRLPKKLNTSILDEVQRTSRNLSANGMMVQEAEDDIVFGWGVHILEGPNQAGLSFILALGIAVALLVSCLVAWLAKTEEQGFGVGQFLIAIVACSMPAVYYTFEDY